MARVTTEDCLLHVDNKYELVHVATRRVRQLGKGSEPLVRSKNRMIVTALREVAAGKIRVFYDNTNTDANDLDGLVVN